MLNRDMDSIVKDANELCNRLSGDVIDGTSPEGVGLMACIVGALIIRDGVIDAGNSVGDIGDALDKLAEVVSVKSFTS